MGFQPVYNSHHLDDWDLSSFILDTDGRLGKQNGTPRDIEWKSKKEVKILLLNAARATPWGCWWPLWGRCRVSSGFSCCWNRHHLHPCRHHCRCWHCWRHLRKQNQIFQLIIIIKRIYELNSIINQCYKHTRKRERERELSKNVLSQPWRQEKRDDDDDAGSQWQIE